MKKSVLLAFVAVLALTACSRYQSVKGDPMQAKIYTLDNGLKVYMTVNKDEPRIQTFIAVHAGGKDDPADNTGLAHYLEHMMFKGTENFGTQDYAAEKPLLDQIDSLFEVYRTLTDPQERLDLYKEIDAVSYEASKHAIPNEYDKLMSIIGADDCNAFTSNDVTCYYEDIPSNQIENWARIEADRFMNCVFRGFHTELEAVYEEKNTSMVSDWEKAFDALNELLFVNHPYGTQTVIGTQEHLKNPSLKAIRYQKDTYYVPNNVAICLSGDFDPDQMVRIIEKYFSQWAPNPDLPRRSIPEEVPITRPKIKEVLGYEAEMAFLGWRTPGASFPESDLGDIVSSILYNGQAGLVDLDCINAQSVLEAGVFHYSRSDWGEMIAEIMPKEGQSLEEAVALVLAEVEKLRNGDFSDELVEAVKANYKLSQMQSLTSNFSRAYMFMRSFINETSWEWEVGRIGRIEKVTKADIVDWANKYLGADSYAVVYKRLGEDTSIRKIDAPAITPIETNRDKQSAFLAEIAASEPAPIEPVFVDWEKDMTVSEFNGLELLYKKNEKNDIATLSFRYDKGLLTDSLLDLATDYCTYLGSDQYSNDDFVSALYALACSGEAVTSDNTSQVRVTGLSENLEKALSLYEYQLSHLEADPDILEELKADQLRTRADAKKSQQACNAALRDYMIYGKDYIACTTLNNEALMALTPEQLLESLKSLLGSQHKILYYGPASLEEVKTMLANAHNTEGLAPVRKQYKQKQLTSDKQVFVVHYDARQFNYNQYSDRGESMDLSQDPQIWLFNEYYGGSMNSIVFQEMRESRALAYHAWAELSEPHFKGDNYSFRTIIASQNDKLRKAVEGFEEIIENLPAEQANLDIAKAAILSRLRTQRVTGEEVLYSYLTAQELGLAEPREKQVFEKVGDLTMDDLLATHEKWIKGRTYWYGIVGDTSDMDMAFLRSLGPVKVLSLEEIFGY